MNNTLSFPRLAKLMRKHWIENFSFYGLAALALFGLLAVVFAIWVNAEGAHYTEEAFYVIYFVGLFLGGCIFASISFSMLGDKAKGGFWLSLPASHLEKLITIIFFVTIVFFLAYNASYLILRSITLGYIQHKVETNPMYHYREVKWGNGAQEGFGIVFRSLLYVFFSVQALYLMGSAFFSKHAFIKTTIIGAAIIFLFSFYTYKLSEWAIPKNVFTGRFMEPSQTAQDVLLWIVKLIWVPVFWVITLFRLREKQL